MNFDGTIESSEGILNSSNIPFTTLLNIPIGNGNIPIQNASSSMLTPPPSSDITTRNGNNSFDTRSATATPTTISAAHVDSLRAHQNLTAGGILQSPECYGIINSLIRRHQLETPPTPTIQPASDSVLSLWPNGIYDDYLGIINIIRQYQQASSPQFSHTNNGSSVRSLWPSDIREDDGIHNRSVPKSQYHSFGSQEHYAIPSSLANAHKSFASQTSSSPSSKERRLNTSVTSSSKSQSKRNAHVTSIPSCTPKSLNQGLTHITSLPSFSQKSPGIGNTISSISPKTPKKTPSSFDSSLCSQKSLKKCDEKKSLFNSNAPNTFSPISLSGSEAPLSSSMCILTSTVSASGVDIAAPLDLNILGANEILSEKIIIASTSSSMPSSEINEVIDSANVQLSNGFAECTTNIISDGKPGPLVIPVLPNVLKEIPSELSSQPSNAEEPTTTGVSTSTDTNIVSSLSTVKTNSGGSDGHKSCSRLLVCPDVNSNTERCSSKVNSCDEEKIDVWSVKDSLLLKIVEPHVMAKDTTTELEPGKDTDDMEPGSPQLISHLGSHCSRSVPSLMKFYSRHKRSLNSSLSINLAVSGQATPPCSPISPGTHYANTLQFSNSGALPILSPSSFTQPNNIANISSPSSNSLYFHRNNQISPHEELHVTISANDNALIPISKHVTSNTNSVLTTSLMTPLNTLLSANTKKLSFEASTMTSPTEKSIASLPTSSALRGVDFNTSNRHCYATTTSTTQVNDTNRTRLSPIAALTLLTVPTVVPNSMYSTNTTPSHAKLSSPPMQPSKKLKVEENDQSTFTHVNLSIPLNHSVSLSVPTTTKSSSLGPIHNGMPYPSPWSIPHTPLPHPGSYWLPPPSQFSGGEAGIGAASLGLGYHVARDQLTGQLFLLPRPHPLSDPSGHGLMWTGYGSMTASPVVMTPQQLLLGDPHYGHSIHSSLMHLHHPPPPILSSPSKKVESPSMILEDKKSHSPIGASHTSTATELPLPQPLATQHFMFPPTTLPYYCSQPPPSHPSHYSLSGYPHVPNPTLGMPTNLIQALTTTPFTTSTPTLTTAASILAPLTVTPTFSNGKISSSASSSVWSRGSDIPISSPGLHYEPHSTRNADIYADPPMDLTQRSKSPQNLKIDTEAQRYDVNKSKSHVSKFGVASHKLTRPLVIKKEIKEEVLSPPLTVNSEEESNSESKTKHNFKLELGVTFPNIEKDSVSGSETEHFDAMLCPQHSLDHVLDLTSNDKQSSEKSNYKETSTSKSEIDSSGLELLLQTMFPTEKHRLAASPILDIDSNSSHSEQMPHLERAAKTPSPRCSPCSYESLPPVLTPFAPIPTILVESPDYQHTSPPVNVNSFDELRSDEYVGLPSHQQPKPNCFSFLCALAEQRILEEQQDNCSALSSLADVALSTPDLPIFESTDENIDESLIKENLNVNDPLVASTSFSEFISPLDIQFQEKEKAADINRNYKSPESQREVKAFIANKVSQYNKEFVNDSNLPNYQNQIEEMDPAEVDMRMKLAAIQKKYKEKQHELSKLLPKKDSFSPSKRGRGRPPKPKLISTSPGIKRKVGRPQKKLSETLSDPKEDENCFKFESDTDICSNEPNPDSQTIVPLQIKHLPDLAHETLKLGKLEEASEEDTDLPSDCMDPLFKPPSAQLTEARHEDSDDDVTSETSSKRDHIHLHAETSVESSTSDAEIHLSSSKKRKPGRPKKHSPTKYDATETIVAKKSKSLGFLLLQKSKIKPKLKAELKIRDRDEEEDEDNDFNNHSSKCAEASDENHEEINSKLQKSSSVSHSKGNNSVHKQLSLNIQHHGAPRGRTSLSRNTILRDKEKRKSTFEKNSQMQQLFRSLKRHSKVADPEHDESGDEREDNSDDEELDSKECITSVCNLDVNTKDCDQCSLPNLILNSFQVSTQETSVPTVDVKQEDNMCETTHGENPAHSKPIMENIKLEDDAKTDDYEGELTTANPEKEKDISICTLQVEDLVRGARVLVLQDGLLYAGNLIPITPPDVYGVHIDGERGTRPHICCQEELLTQSWKEVKPGSTRFLTEGTRVCAFWSQQYRGLYPGCVAAASSPSHEGNHNLVNVEFDDGDSGRIHVDDIRLLPEDFPVIEYDPNPLVTMNKRKRRPTEEDNSEFKTTEGANKKVNNDAETTNTKVKKGNHKKKETTSVPSEERKDMNVEKCDALNVKIERKALMSSNQSRTEDIRTSPLSEDELNHFNVDNTLCNKKVDVHKWATENFLLDTKSNYNKSIKRRRALSLSSSGKKHKKRHHSDTHKHRHKHKKRRRTLEDSWLHPHIEQGDNELKMRIRSPPPHQEDSVAPPHFECNESSASDDEEPTKEIQNKVSRKPQRRLKRSPSEKSKIAPFLPEKQLWKWSGKGYKRPGGKGKGKKEFYKEIVRGNERIRVGDCAVFLSSGSPDRPFIGKIDFLWEGWGGNMVVKVRWFYHPDETKEAERKLTDPRDALFSSSHTDENDVQTISHKCEVVPLADYKLKRTELDERKDTESENNDDLYYLAGFYDTTHERITMEPGVS